jgi:hypothetical protein
MMGRSSWEFRESVFKRDKEGRLHPAWRGVGCILVVSLSVAGYFFAGWFLRANAENHWIYLPPDLINPPISRYLAGGVIVQIVVGFLFLLSSFTILNFVYALLFPIEPGEYDVPLERKRTRKTR